MGQSNAVIGDKEPLTRASFELMSQGRQNQPAACISAAIGAAGVPTIGFLSTAAGGGERRYLGLGHAGGCHAVSHPYEPHKGPGLFYNSSDKDWLMRARHDGRERRRVRTVRRVQKIWIRWK